MKLEWKTHESKEYLARQTASEPLRRPRGPTLLSTKEVPSGLGTCAQTARCRALGLRYEDLPERVVADVKLRVLDTLGLVISGAGTPMGRAVHAASGSLGSGRRARLIPSGKRTSAPTAALAHGTQAHAEDFDDTHNESIMHSSAPVVATALALGEWVRERQGSHRAGRGRQRAQLPARLRGARTVSRSRLSSHQRAGIDHLGHSRRAHARA